MEITSVPKKSDDDTGALLASVLAYIGSEPLQPTTPDLAQENTPNDLQRACSASDDADLDWILGE